MIQHNGQCTAKISGFYTQEFSKLNRRLCGNIPRIVTVDNVCTMDSLVSVITTNKNCCGQVTLCNIHVKTSCASGLG